MFFFNDTATTEIYTLSLHDALPISGGERAGTAATSTELRSSDGGYVQLGYLVNKRSEEHTSELQSQSNLVCRLLLEKKKQTASIPQETVTCLAAYGYPLLDASLLTI